MKGIFNTKNWENQFKPKPKKDKAVSQVIGVMLLTIMAVVVAVVIYMEIIPMNVEPYEQNILIMGYISDDNHITLEHMGGVAINTYTITIGRGNMTYTYEYHDQWMIGGHKQIPKDDLDLSDGSITLYLFDLNGFTLFNGVFSL